jgi:3-methylcrotonyl-CoA carboxylase alpha subunit
MFEKILIAGRGEIACRIIKTAQKRGIKTVAVYSEADINARHVRCADEAYLIGGAAAKDSYLKADVILDVAKKSGAQAVHPGYGFLSENAEFSESCAAAGIKFIGPSADSIRSMGLKDKAKDIMIAAGVPVVPGYQGETQEAKFLKEKADEITYPVLIKAVAGGGGKGMRLVESSDEFLESLASCQREAEASFGNAHVLLEKYLTKPRHIELQVFGDTHGEAVYLFERDCSLQRRHQKVVEEAPAPDMTDAMRKAMGDAAVAAANAISYEGAGTIEFIVDVRDGLENAPFYFMEMNTRLQVEHPVTELITGQDLVDWQFKVAAGEKLPLRQEELTLKGHAFEVRLYAEDPINDFLPQTGHINYFSVPEENENFRFDTGVEAGDEVSIYYDPMIAKLIVWGTDRAEALRHMSSILENVRLSGVKTNLEFLGAIFKHQAFKDADLDTGFIPRYVNDLLPKDVPASDLSLILTVLSQVKLDENASDPWVIADGFELNREMTTEKTFIDGEEKRVIAMTYGRDEYSLQLGDNHYKAQIIEACAPHIKILLDGLIIKAEVTQSGRDFTVFQGGSITNLHHFVLGVEDASDAGGSGVIITPMPGKVLKVMTAVGDEVIVGQPLLILEAMKMEHTIKSAVDGVIEQLSLSEGTQVSDGEILVKITESGEDD